MGLWPAVKINIAWRCLRYIMKILTTVVALFFSAWVVASPLKNMVVFGDSLSDNGNLYEYLKGELPMSPPYFKGRFTNGPVWIELLTRMYYPTNAKAHLLDYAFGGAGVLEGSGGDEDDEVDALFTLSGEVDSYLLSHEDKADASSLYVVWMGANNYLAIPDADDAEQVVSATNLGIVHDLQRLVDKGAKHIMVVNLPDLGKTPAARDFDSIDLLSSLSEKHNAMLAENIAILKENNPTVEWFLFDVHQILNDMLELPQQYGLTNITDTCYEEMVSARHSNRSILSMVSTVKPRAKTNACTGYLFFDPVHPSEIAHQEMAKRTKKMLDMAGVTFE